MLILPSGFIQQVDLTARAGLSVLGYKPRTYLDDAAEYYTYDL